jgi:hypothetical protein
LISLDVRELNRAFSACLSIQFESWGDAPGYLGISPLALEDFVTANGGIHRQPGATPQGFVQRPNPTALKARFIPGIEE